MVRLIIFHDLLLDLLHRQMLLSHAVWGMDRIGGRRDGSFHFGVGEQLVIDTLVQRAICNRFRDRGICSLNFGAPWRPPPWRNTIFKGVMVGQKLRAWIMPWPLLEIRQSDLLSGIL